MTGFAKSLARCLLIAGLVLSSMDMGHQAYARSSTSASSSSNAPVFYIPLNRSELVTTRTDMGEVIIADPDVADVVVHGKRRISVVGKEVGQTTLRVFDTDHKIIRSMDVFVTYDLPALRRALKQFLPNERIGVSLVNTRIALTGDISSATSAATAMEIAQEYVHAKLSNADAETRKVNDGKTNDSPVINLMKINAAQQVMLRIKVGEVQRDTIKNLGVSLQAFGTSGPDFLLGTGIGRLAPPTGSSTAQSFTYKTLSAGSNATTYGTAGIWSHGASGVGAAIEALEEKGLFKVLAEPSLTAISGEEAEFLAGGEFPIPVPQQNGVTTIEFKKFGVAMKFTPYVLSQNRLRVQVAPEVSDTSNEHSFTTSDGFVVPSIVTRRASTTVELAPGESFMIAGLLRDSSTSTINQIPGAGDIPILGALFRSVAYQRKETELVIAVTPYLVDPVKDSDIKLPTDDYHPASFLESIFFGAVSSNHGLKDPSLEGPTGFMTD